MTRVVTVEPFSLKRFMDKHKYEAVISVPIPVGLYLLFVTFTVFLPYSIAALLAGTRGQLEWGVFYLILAAFGASLGVKMIVTASLQLMISKSLKSMQFARTKRLCLQSISLLSHWPLVRNAQLVFFEVGLGAVCMGRADYEEAEKLFASALERYKNHMQRFRFGKKARHTPNLVLLNSHISRACSAQGKYAEAEQLANVSLALAQGLEKTKNARIVVFPLYALAYTHLRSGALEQAEEEYKRVFNIYAETPEPSAYGSTTFAPTLMASSLGLAFISIKKERADESIKYWTNFADRASQPVQPMSPSFLRAMNVLANEYMNNKLFAEAEQVIEMAYSLAMHHFDHPDAKDTLSYFEKLLLLTDRQVEVGDMRAWLRISQHAPH